MKRVRKAVSIVLAAGISLSCLSACSGQKTSGSVQSESAPVKLTALFCKHPLTKDVTKMQWLTDLEKKNKVEVEWQQISADWDQKKSAMFASGEIPDLLFSAVGDSDFVQFPGLFEDLTPLLEKDAPNITKMFQEHPELKTLATQQDGKIYSTPKYQRFWPKTNTTMFINKQWLDKLGMSTPTTWDELYDVLTAFKTKDPNGNGKNDEIPMDFQGMGGAAYSAQLCLGSLGIQITDCGGGGYFAEDGKIKNFFEDERFKTLVLYLRKLWSAGLINKEAFTQDYSKFQSLARGEGKTAKVGFTWGWETTDRFGNELADQYVPVPQLKVSADSSSDLRWAYDYNTLNYGTNRVAMSAGCQNKDAAVKFVDSFYDPVVSMQVLFGGMNETDKCIKENGDGTYAILPPSDSSLDPGSWKWTNSFADNGPIYISDDLKLTLGTDMQAVNKEKSVYDDLLAKADPKKDVYPQVFMKYSQDDTNTMAMNDANIGNVTSTWANWVAGKSDISKDWDGYVQKLSKAGLPQNISIRQKAYEEYLKTVK